MAEPTKAELQQLLTDATNRATTSEARVEQLTGELATANDRADGLAKGFAERGAEIDTLRTEIRTLNNSLKAYKGSATKARGEATVLKNQLSPVARSIGPMKPARSEEETQARKDALDAAIAGGPTELVFSDGRREIRELAPLSIGGDAWRETPHGRVLNAEPLLEPGACSKPQLELRGFALLNEAGDQVGYCPLPDTILVPSGSQMRLPHNTIRF